MTQRHNERIRRCIRRQSTRSPCPRVAVTALAGGATLRKGPLPRIRLAPRVCVDVRRPVPRVHMVRHSPVPVISLPTGLTVYPEVDVRALAAWVYHDHHVYNRKNILSYP